MKVLVIPDVHLKPWMFERAEEIMKKGMAERAVCLMDIPDDWNQEYNLELYRNTFDAVIAFAKRYPDTLWCYGNHDLSYLWNKRESGYSPAAAYTVAKKLDELACALPEGNEIRYVQKIDQVLFCHGGILDYFVRNAVSSANYDDVDEVVRTLNGLSWEYMWNNFSPIWYRPQESAERMYKPKGTSASGGTYPGGADMPGVECAVLRCVLHPQGRNADRDGGVCGSGYGELGI